MSRVTPIYYRICLCRVLGDVRDLEFRFDKNEKVDFQGFIFNTTAGGEGLQITEASLGEGKLVLKAKR